MKLPTLLLFMAALLGTRSLQAQPGATTVQLKDLGTNYQTERVLPAPAGNTREIIIPGDVQPMVGQYSPTLRAYFIVRWFRWRDELFPGARLLSEPEPGSPLRSINIHAGDIISRLDDQRVYDYDEIERHYANTSVRFVKPLNGAIRYGTIYIDMDLEHP